MDLDTAQFIVGDRGRAALERLAGQPGDLTETRQLATLDRLRRDFTNEQAAGLWEVALAQLRATKQAKFSRADEMFFTRSGLEQASGERIAAHRAERMRQRLGTGRRVADLGCGIGGDSLGLARYFRVTGVDLDPARLTFAQANAAVYDLSEAFEIRQADLMTFDPTGFEALFFDPARRTDEGRRLFSVEDYGPPLSIIRGWLKTVPNLGVKIAPGVNYGELAGYECEIEIISENGDVKEAVLWFGELGDRAVKRRATLLPSGATLITQADKEPVAVGSSQAILYEPDGAVIRAGLVEELAHQLHATKLDPDIAYLTADTLQATPFAQPYRIIESGPFNLKKLNRRLNELAVGRVVIKKRGSPLEPTALERALKLKGRPDREIVIVLTHVKGVHSAILCEKPSGSDS